MKVWNKIRSFFSATVPYFTFLGIQLSMLIFAMIAMLVYRASINKFGLDDFNDAREIEICFICQFLCGFVCIAAIFSHMKFYSFKFSDISPEKQNGRTCTAVVFFSIGAFFVISFINNSFIQLTGIKPEESFFGISTLTTLLWLLPDIVFAIVEELLFRGLLFKRYEKDFSVIFAAIVITIEGTLTNTPGVMLYVLIYSLILFYIRRRFGDIRLCIIMHLIMNLFKDLSALISAEYYAMIMNIGAVAGVVIAAVSMYLMIKSADAPEKAPKMA